MITKNKVSAIQKLHLKKHREDSNLFIVEGIKSVGELLASDWRIEELFVTGEYLKWCEQMKSPLSSVREISEADMKKLSGLKTPPGVLAIVHKKQFSTGMIEPEQPLLVLDGIRDPGNLGTIIRSADWFGIKQVLCSPDTVELTNPKTIQSTMGSFTRVKVIYSDLYSYIKERDKAQVHGAFMDGHPLDKVPFRSNDIIVIGNEANGISREVASLISHKIAIPSFSITREVESLNASIATAIILYQYKSSTR